MHYRARGWSVPAPVAGLCLSALVAASLLLWREADAVFTSSTPNGSNSLALATLAAPEPLSCTWTGTSSLQLTWTQTGSAASGYQYERSDSLASGYAALGTTSGGSSVTATDPNPSPPTVRYYRVAATAGSLWTSPYTTPVASDTCVRTIKTYLSAGTATTPYGVAVDASGNLFTGDGTNHKVLKTTPAGVTTTYAGTGTAGYSGDGGAATAAKINTPLGLTVDAGGNLYIADDVNYSVRKVTTGGTITTVVGTGVFGYSGDGGQATSARLKGVSAVAFDPAGNLYVADWSADVVRKVTPGGVISTFAGTGTGGYSGDNGPATSATLNGPRGLAVDSSGTVYIADADNNVIRKVSTGGTITTVAGGGASSACTFSGSGTSVSLNGPRRLIYDATANRLLIPDRFNHCIRALALPGSTISQVAGTGTLGYTGDSGPAVGATLDEPGAVALNSSGDLFIADSANNAVRKVISP